MEVHPSSNHRRIYYHPLSVSGPSGYTTTHTLIAPASKALSNASNREKGPFSSSVVPRHIYRYSAVDAAETLQDGSTAADYTVKQPNGNLEAYIHYAPNNISSATPFTADSGVFEDALAYGEKPISNSFSRNSATYKKKLMGSSIPRLTTALGKYFLTLTLHDIIEYLSINENVIVMHKKPYKHFENPLDCNVHSSFSHNDIYLLHKDMMQSKSKQEIALKKDDSLPKRVIYSYPLPPCIDLTLDD